MPRGSTVSWRGGSSWRSDWERGRSIIGWRAGGCTWFTAACLRSGTVCSLSAAVGSAAVLASGEGAVLSHRSAAALWGIRADQPALVQR